MKSYYRFRFRHLRRNLHDRLVIMYGFGRKLIKNYLFKRSSRLKYVQRFMASWLAVFALAGLTQFWQFNNLRPYYLVERPVLGGVYIEGVMGDFSSFNPLFTDSLPSKTANRLIFSGLAKKDTNGTAVPDLADKWQIGRGGASYTVSLKPNLKWHDGAPLSAEDVVFTIGLIQDSSVRSGLRDTWQGVSVKAIDNLTVEFKLPAPFAPFPSLLTVGLLPHHLLKDTEPSQLRVSDYNLQPVGSGPYKFERLVNGDEVRLSAFDNYAHGKPNISNFIIRAYKNYGRLADAYRSREITGVGGFSPVDEGVFTNNSKASHRQWQTSSQTFLFMNMAGKYLNERPLRQAIVQAIDNHRLAAQYQNNLRVARSPLLPEHLGYDSSLIQPSYDLKQATRLLDESGWARQPDGTRQKARRKLKLKLVTIKNDIYPLIASQIQDQLAKAGIGIELIIKDAGDLQRQHIAPRDYDLLLFNVSLGADADAYAYWHSSQIGPEGFNFSSYKSGTADEALQAGRTRIDEAVRAAKYKAFLTVWRQDLPAVALYRHTYPYIYRGVEDIGISWLTEPLDRFNEVHSWSVKKEFQLKRLVE